ncbi:MAG: hypothetical protein PWP31_1808 [Clostridia bacterium]|jgi:predicted  nucleic acid-binding Zn-ribbon protein|nr:hypothetical protein [Clostridia bacterium]
MECKPTLEQINDFKEHIVWRWLNDWIEKRKADIKERLLLAKDYDEVKQLQIEYQVYKSMQNKIMKGN